MYISFSWTQQDSQHLKDRAPDTGIMAESESWPQVLEELRTRFQSNQPRRGDTESNEEAYKSEKPKSRRKIAADGLVFKMHYQFTSTFLLASALVLATNIGLGSPITCYGESLGMNSKDLEAYCINYGVRIQKDIKGTNTQDSKYHLWYQWTPIILLIQSVLFYIPHWLWKHCENGWVDGMVKDLRRSDLVKAGMSTEKMQLTAECLRKGKSANKLFGLSLFACELLNLANVFLQLFLINLLFNNYFLDNPLSAGKLIEQSYANRTDPLENAFPKSISCPRKTYGPSGTPINNPMLCEVAVNHFNEMCVFIMWYWFLILLPCTLLSFIATTSTVVMPCLLRSYLRMSNKAVTPAMWKKIFRHLGPFDLMVLQTMLKEMYPKMAEDFLKEIAKQVSPQRSIPLTRVKVTSV